MFYLQLDEYRINEGSIRKERATFNGPSVYGFNGNYNLSKIVAI